MWWRSRRVNDLIGNNNPPDQTVTAADTMRDISAFLSENPLIDEAHAREAKLFIDRGKLAIADLEAERDMKVRPLNEKVKEINSLYKIPRANLETVLSELQARLSSFLKAEEQKRIDAAREAARIADDAKQRAREAERIEQDALGSANSGELGVDIASVVVEADDAFRAYQKADRQAAIAERETKVKISGGFGRALSLKTKETLLVTDAIDAIHAIGVTESITEAILTSARAYRKLHGKLPAGVISETERKV
jgi:hypothetical protein